MMMGIGFCMILVGAAGTVFSWQARETAESARQTVERNRWAAATGLCLLLFLNGIAFTLMGII